MNRRGIRATLLVLALAATGGAGWMLFQLQLDLAERRTAREAFDHQALEVSLDLANLRAAQQAYVAEGQGRDFWMARADRLLAAVEQGLTGLASHASSGASRAAVEAASGVLAEYRKLDGRARQYLRSEQGLMASDVIFTDSLAATTTAADRIEAARQHELELLAGELRDRELQQAWIVAAAAGVWLVLALLLLPVKAGSAETSDAGGPAALDEVEEFARVIPNPPVAPLAPAPLPPALDLSLREPVAAAAPAPDLANAARVCADLARVLDAGDLPGLLGRAAGVLDATGLIVWVADRSGGELFPLFTHGYAPYVLARLGALRADDDNAAAAAFRAGELRTVPGDGGAPGAIVSPIITSEGCVGVLASEVAGGRENDERLQALATIFAAQLATFVTAVPGSADQSQVAQA